MTTQEQLNYERVAKAIAYIKRNLKNQPSLDKIAEAVHISPYHFQRLFTNWAGVSPKKFMQYLSVNYAKKLLKEQQPTLFDAAYEVGLSGTGRLHDLFINIEGMTPGEYKNGGKQLCIKYNFAATPFGAVCIASTVKGICHMAFIANKEEGFSTLSSKFPNAQYHLASDENQENALAVFQRDWNKLHQIKLHLTGTNFQLKVWETLLKIPKGNLATYGAIAKKIEKPTAARAVGTAIGNNPVAFLIPCHRVIRSSGETGEYCWGEIRKSAIIGWEASEKRYSN